LPAETDRRPVGVFSESDSKGGKSAEFRFLDGNAAGPLPTRVRTAGIEFAFRKVTNARIGE
jgi:hypothetical protein